VAHGLVLRHDHGSQYMSQIFQEGLAILAIKQSPEVVREPQDNGCAARFIRTRKEHRLWITAFDTVEPVSRCWSFSGATMRPGSLGALGTKRPLRSDKNN
jgi:putative transposase